ncbi:MAG TPA: hypothetical protein P5280_02980 [Cyclobacteriaceae bacterium]|nr:hypothetical protein [Cyclobacteriaceae bacterium]
MTGKEKTFDAVAFQRKHRAEIYEIIKDKTPEERIAYFNDAPRRLAEKNKQGA